MCIMVAVKLWNVVILGFAFNVELCHSSLFRQHTPNYKGAGMCGIHNSNIWTSPTKKFKQINLSIDMHIEPRGFSHNKWWTML